MDEHVGLCGDGDRSAAIIIVVIIIGVGVGVGVGVGRGWEAGRRRDSPLLFPPTLRVWAGLYHIIVSFDSDGLEEADEVA